MEFTVCTYCAGLGEMSHQYVDDRGTRPVEFGPCPLCNGSGREPITTRRTEPKAVFGPDTAMQAAVDAIKKKEKELKS